MSKEEKQIKKTLVSVVLSREVTDEEMQFIYEDWKAFHDDPVMYSGTAVVALVNEYLDGFNAQPEYLDILSGAQSVMEDDII